MRLVCLIVHNDADARQSVAITMRLKSKRQCQCGSRRVKKKFRNISALTTAGAGIPESKKFAGIQNSVRIERLLEPTMKVTCDIARGVGPPAFFRQTDSVFACDDTAPA